MSPPGEARISSACRAGRRRSGATSFRSGFRVDNVRWAPDGSLLAAGQGGAAPAQTTNVVRIDPASLKVQEIIRHPNSPEFGAGTVAVQIGKEIWVGSFRGDRIAIFPAGQ